MSKLHNKQLLFPLSGSFTGSLLGSASYALTASYAMNATIIDTGSFATTGSNIFKGNQTITGSDGRIVYNGTNTAPDYTLASIHANNDYPWLERFYNDTFSTSSAIMAYFGHNDGRFVFHNESTQSIGLQVNGYSAENGLLVYSNKVAFVNNAEVTGSLNVVGGITGSLFGTASWAKNANVFPFSGSADITGSMYVVGPTNIVSIPTYQSTDFFLVRNAVTTFKVNRGVEITSSAQIPLQINNETSQSILQISQSGLITFATFSFDQTGTAPNGGVYFTSASMYIGLD